MSGTGRLAVDVRLYPPDRLRRDIDNFGGKALLDALTEAGFWQDDRQVAAYGRMEKLYGERGEWRVRVRELEKADTQGEN